jgi:peptidoglycan/xylan/chitin deacetylase (PgdA/CDA1 family)
MANGSFRIGHRLRRLHLPILYYHEVGPEASKHAVTPEAFAAQMAWLAEHGFHVLSIDAVAGVVSGQLPAPEKAVAVTFDDGREGVLRHAAPVLAEHGFPATMYAVTTWLDGAEVPEVDRYSAFLDWDGIGELRSAGFTIGSHTCTHRNLKKIPESDLEAEVTGSRARLEDRLGCAVWHFSFPKGRATPPAHRAVRAAGYRTAVLTSQRSNGRLARLRRLYRLRVEGHDDLAAFARLLSV